MAKKRAKVVTSRRSARHDLLIAAVGAVLGAVTAAVAPIVAANVLEPKKSDLRIVDFAVEARSVTSEAVGDFFGEAGYGIETPPLLTMVIHNLGNRRAVITRVRLTIEESVTVHECAGIGGAYTTSAVYDVVLPSRPAEGQVLTQRVGHEIGSDEVDSFSILLGLADDLETHLYRIRVAMIYDSGHTLEVGTAVVSIPRDLSSDYFSPEFEVSLDKIAGARESRDPCVRENALAVAEFLRGPGVRSSAMVAITEALG